VSANVIDNNGSGDMSAGAVLCAINTGHNYERAAKFANAASARVVSQLDQESDQSNMTN